jgi:hypothetical protein
MKIVPKLKPNQGILRNHKQIKCRVRVIKYKLTNDPKYPATPPKITDTVINHSHAG